ncbi:hypothetical protein [Mesorhizobium delmotii]|uniref:Uncharacterized protein n=1 Tax=Mesorhizobium delmotii TaxID=1631247 RepID=A0A2P9AQ95_9HYPH|nr:hypothetical protein [Mesorhizobium delmotii]SJM33262.1 hypothetical protein BQ8482_340158 [Mesorhizobium delmotii]
MQLQISPNVAHCHRTAEIRSVVQQPFMSAGIKVNELRMIRFGRHKWPNAWADEGSHRERAARNEV